MPTPDTTTSSARGCGFERGTPSLYLRFDWERSSTPPRTLERSRESPMAIHENLNLTPFATAIGSCTDKDGQALAVAVVRATFDFTAKGEVSAAPAKAQQPVVEADVPFGEPGSSSIQYASEVSPPKPGTDVAIVGHAYGRGRKEIEAG